MNPTNAIATYTPLIWGMPIPLVSALLAAAVSAIISIIIARFTIGANRRQHIENMISKIIDISITYPYLEDDAFCAAWPLADKTDREAMRYENYCCLVFNLLETLWQHCDGDSRKIDDMFFAREMIMRHKTWWKSDSNNLGGYNIEFHRYIDSVIKGTPK